MTRRYRVTPLARRDLSDIARYSRHQWGTAQATRYIRGLEDTFERLGESPFIGVVRDDLREGARAHSHHSHLIVYRVHRNVVEVLRVVHHSRDIYRLFS